MAGSYKRMLIYLRRNGWILTPAGLGMICAQTTIRAGRQSIIPLYGGVGPGPGRGQDRAW